MTFDATKAPFPWNGGKSRAASAVWAALGDVAHYVEPFAGSLAVLLGRPHEANRPYYSETVGDADALIANAWRAVRDHPDEVATHASWPVSEVDLHARHCRLIQWRDDREVDHLCGDPDWSDSEIAGWWLWGVASWIGTGFCSSNHGPWWPDDDGHLVKGAGRGVKRQRPNINNNGMGVNAPQLRERGVWRQLPHISNDGRCVNSAGLRERQQIEFGDVMPKLVEWMRLLSARMRHVRIVAGDWKRICTRGAVETLSVRTGGLAGIFLDPPYSTDVRGADLYGVDDGTVAKDVLEWCVAHTDRPWRIVLAGYADEEHAGRLLPLGWREVSWTGNEGLIGSGQQKDRDRRAQERLWCSPACEGARQQLLF